MYSSHGVYHSRARTSSSGEGLGYHTHVTECNKNSEVSKRQVYGGNIYNFTCARLLLPRGTQGGILAPGHGYVSGSARAGGARTVGRGPPACGGRAGTLVAGGVTRLVIVTRLVNTLCHTASVVPDVGRSGRAGGWARTPRARVARGASGTTDPTTGHRRRAAWPPGRRTRGRAGTVLARWEGWGRFRGSR